MYIRFRKALHLYYIMVIYFPDTNRVGFPKIAGTPDFFGAQQLHSFLSQGFSNSPSHRLSVAFIETKTRQWKSPCLHENWNVPRNQNKNKHKWVGRADLLVFVQVVLVSNHPAIHYRFFHINK